MLNYNSKTKRRKKGNLKDLIEPVNCAPFLAIPGKCSHNSSSLLTPYGIFVEKAVQIVSRKTPEMLNIFECLIRKGKMGEGIGC